MQQQELDYVQDYEFNGEVPYYFSPCIGKQRIVKGKTYTVRSYFKGGKDFEKTIKQLAIKQAYKK